MAVAQIELFNYSFALETYSSFPKDKILNVLLEILTTLEGVEFRFESDSEEFFICQSIVYDAKKSKVKFSKDILKSLGKLVQLDERYFSDNSIRFYKLFANGDFKVKPSFPGYEYLTEFINIVVSYRLENKVKEISDSELERLKNQFLLEKLGEKRDALINLMDGVSKKRISSDSDNK